jgi:hypothetical protein
VKAILHKLCLYTWGALAASVLYQGDPESAHNAKVAQVRSTFSDKRSSGNDRLKMVLNLVLGPLRSSFPSSRWSDQYSGLILRGNQVQISTGGQPL